MKHVKLFEQFLNEANNYYIETWYKDRNGNEVQLLGSDGTTVMKKMPKAGDVDQHANRINSLRKIKPFLVGEVMYRVVGPDGRVHRTINDTIEEGLNEGYYDKPFYVISIDSEMSDRATDQYTGEGKPARVIATFDDQAEAKKFASEKKRGLKTLTKTKRKMHDKDYKVVPGDRSKLTNIKESSINEAKNRQRD